MTSEAYSGPVPRHVAIIMDGNGRWATQRGLPRARGHEAGADAVREVVRACGRHGVDVLTLFSFSTENWGRPEEEVEALMGLLEHYLRTEIPELMRQGVRLGAIGERERLPDVVRQLLDAAELHTCDNTGMRLLIALSYGSRAELTRAVRAIADEVAAGTLAPQDIDEQTIDAQLYTADVPNPDLLVRTSGEMRLSNFLLWQIAYAELYVTDVHWPDFREPHLLQAFEAYGRRQRRFGKTADQLEEDA